MRIVVASCHVIVVPTRLEFESLEHGYRALCEELQVLRAGLAGDG